jgi:hypothetical protein
MFTDFFYLLRKRNVPTSITEWMTLMQALYEGHITNLEEFYYTARAILIKSETLYDQYDLVFQEFFEGKEFPEDIRDEIFKWLEDPRNIDRTILSEEERALFDEMNLDELMKEFEKRLQEQTEQHDGGGYWIGRGGTSPFGHSGYHPGGIRVGGESHRRSAVQIAKQRKFKNYRSDLTLDVRQMKMALRGLRQLSRIGLLDELDLDETVKATSKNAGDLELIWKKSRKNAVRLLLLMDVGGSMIPFTDLCNQLFSAAATLSHFRDFQYFYFHNCIYDNLYTDAERMDPISTDYLLRTLESDYKVVLVGDARMATSELTEKYGSVNYYERNEVPGILWLKRISEHFTHCAWLNPDSPYYWNHPTVIMISKMFPMFELTLDGLSEGVRKLVVKR